MATVQRGKEVHPKFLKLIITKSVSTVEQLAICRFQTFVHTQEKLPVLSHCRDASRFRIIHMGDDLQGKQHKVHVFLRCQNVVSMQNSFSDPFSGFTAFV